MDEHIVQLTADRLPDNALPVDAEFADLFAAVTNEGAKAAASRSVAFVGLARDIAGIIPATIERIKATGQCFAECHAVVVENDSTDDTKNVLRAWQREQPDKVTLHLEDNGREHLHGFERERVVALAEYRNRCRELVRERCPGVDYVIVIDMDSWGGWSLAGVLNGIGWHERMPAAGCMASTSLFMHYGTRIEGRMTWSHYDNWAYRWLGWEWRIGPWFTFWLPPPGAPPIAVNSSFGGLAIYKAAAYLACTYSGDNGDVEHANFHREMVGRGWRIFHNPGQRCVMHWIVDEATDGGKHGDDQH